MTVRQGIVTLFFLHLIFIASPARGQQSQSAPPSPFAPPQAKIQYAITFHLTADGKATNIDVFRE